MKRVFTALLTLFIVITATFFVVHKMPGDIFYIWALEISQSQGISMEQAQLQAQAMIMYDADQPLTLQYLGYLKGLLGGQLGHSIVYQMSANKIIAQALPWTVLVLSISLLLSFVIGSVLGILIAWRRKTILDPIVTTYASITDATPDYITAMILLVIFAVNLRWFPSKGAYDGLLTPGFNWPFIKDVAKHAVLPIAAFTLESIGGWALLMKGSAVSVLGEDYITAARARGLKERRIAFSYVGRNAVLPSVTALAISLGAMLGGSILIEAIFNYPGIGWFFGQAVARRDYGLMQGLFVMTAFAVIFANLLADLIYARLDPRIRTEE